MTLGELELQARMTFAPFADPACAAAWPVLSRALRPTADDVAALVIPRAATMFQRYVDDEWEQGPTISVVPELSQLDVSLRWAGDVARAGWPRAYEQLAEYLQPEVAWMRLRFHALHERRGVVFDGLAWTGGRWRWLPRPWRALPTTSFAAWGAD